MKHVSKLSPEALAALQKRDKRRLIIMTAAVIVLAITYFVTQGQKKRLESEAGLDLPTVQVPTVERFDVPIFDTLEVLDGIKDTRPQDRVILEPEALNAVFDYGRLLTVRHYDAIDIRDLTPEIYAELMANPSAHRVEPFRARGEIVLVATRKRADNRPEEHAGTIRLDDGTYAHFIVLTLSDGAADVGDFVRVDGMFLKIYSAEGPDGWMEGPLLCGPETIPSYPAFDPSQGIATDFMEEVRDDTLGEVTGLPFGPKWDLMAMALHFSDEVDWNAAPEIDGQMIAELFANPDAYRAKPFRVGISQNLDGGVEKAGENPLRINKITTGWIGNQNWSGQVPYLRYLAPFERSDVGYGKAKYLVAKGFFFKNWSYTTTVGDIRRVPVFVMTSVEPFEVVPDERPMIIMWGVFVATILTAFILWALLARDKKRSAQLHEALVRRRRARREKTA